MKIFILFGLSFFTAFLQTPNIRIGLKNGSEKELQAKVQLERIIKNFPSIISKCVPTDTVVIDEFAFPPHSHPVLTINASYLWNDTVQLAILLHEGLHWILNAMPKEKKEQAVNEYKLLFPDVPAGDPEGAQDIYSTYMHLIGCDLEFQALTIAIGETAARIKLSRKPYYKWIYKTVLNDPRIRQINTRYGFVIR
jgi:hypothetical protein